MGWEVGEFGDAEVCEACEGWNEEGVEFSAEGDVVRRVGDILR